MSWSSFSLPQSHLETSDQERFSVKFQGLDAKLSGVEPARVVKDILM